MLHGELRPFHPQVGYRLVVCDEFHQLRFRIQDTSLLQLHLHTDRCNKYGLKKI